MTKELKTGDVFRFSYNEQASKKFYDPRHCFDGKLIVRENGKLEDTYWGSGGNRWFTLEEAEQQGYLDYIVNLNEVEKINEYERVYYDNSDLFDLSHQHGSYKFYVKRKGAKKSIDKMKETLIEKIKTANREVEYQMNEVTRYQESLLKCEMGVTEGIYI